MIHQKTITASELIGRLHEVLDEIHRNSVVYIVKTSSQAAECKGLPRGMIDSSGGVTFVLGPPPTCGRVLGLVDEEYGWPKHVEVQGIKALEDLVPKWRCHPFIYRGSALLAVSIMIGEYEDIIANSALVIERKIDSSSWPSDPPG